MDDDSERVPPPPNGTEDDVANDQTAGTAAIIPSPSHKSLTQSVYTQSSKIITKSPEKPPAWDMTFYENRLKTFEGWPLTFITPDQMAKAGFYYTGIRDKVRCLFCQNYFECWNKGDDPYIEHRLTSPQCQYFKEKQDNNMSDHKSNFINTYVQNFLRSVGIVTYKNMKVVTNCKALTSLESRVKTFDKCTEILNKDVLSYCEAGLFYLGDEGKDRMLCFCCNQGLMDWEVDDDPWVEHARWSPLCSYVLLSKGKRFVETVGGEVNNSLQINLEELNKLITIHRNFAVEDNERDWESFAECNTFMEFVEPEKILPENRQGSKPDALPDSVLCKICFKEKLEVLFMPCGHVIACIQCAVTLDQCAVCRRPFTMTMRVGIYAHKQKEISLNNFPLECSNDPNVPIDPIDSIDPNDLIDPIVCKVCCKEQMQAVCIPCRHIFTCYKCASNEQNCLLCLEPVYAYMQVFF